MGNVETYLLDVLEVCCLLEAWDIPIQVSQPFVDRRIATIVNLPSRYSF